jgi:hypothetical protein
MACFVIWNAPYVSPAIERIPEEHVRFESMREGLVETYLKAWKSAEKETHHRYLSRREAGPYSPKEFGASRGKPWPNHGHIWPNFDEPLRDRVKKIPKAIKDVVCTSFGYAVSEKFIEVLEACDPGRNQYLPFEFIDRAGNPLPDRRWLLNVTSRLATIDVDRSGPNVVESSNATVCVNAGPTSLIFDKKRIAGRAIWYEWLYVHEGIAVNEIFWSALQKAKCTGWSPKFEEHFPEV